MKLSASDARKKDVNKLVDIVLSDLEKNRFINDQFYSESKAKSMIQRGNSINKIRNYLIGKGINETFIKDTVDKIKEDNLDQDFFSAIKLCKKKRIGPNRDEANRGLFYKKDIGVLARAGFDFEVSRRVMELEKEEYLKEMHYKRLMKEFDNEENLANAEALQEYKRGKLMTKIENDNARKE